MMTVTMAHNDRLLGWLGLIGNDKIGDKLDKVIDLVWPLLYYGLIASYQITDNE